MEKNRAREEVKIRAWEDPKKWSFFLLKKWSSERSFLSIKYRAEEQLLIMLERASYTYVNTLSVCTNAQLCWERSTLSTGGAKLAPSGERSLRWRGWSALAYMEPQWRPNNECKRNCFSTNNLFCVHWCLAPPHISETMHVSVRSTWLNSGALSRDKDFFSEKAPNRLFVRVSTPYNATC